MCVSLVKYSVLLNGEVKGYFEGKNGLCQGDPISLVLFMLIMELLACLLKKGL